MKRWVLIIVLLAWTSTCFAVWPPAQRITPGANNNLHPALSYLDAVVTDTVCLVWQRSRANGWDIYYATNPTGVTWTTPQVLASLPDSNLTPAIGGFHSRWVCAWVNVHGGIQDIAFSRWQAGAWTAPIAISTDGFNDAEPAVWIAQLRDSIWVAWSGYRSGRWSIISRVFNGSSWSPEIPVVTSAGNHRAPRFFQHFRTKLLGLAWQGDASGDWDIYTSRFQGGIWTPPVAVTSGPRADIAPAPTNPYALMGFSQNADLLWASDSLVNFEIFGSMVDSLSIRDRITAHDSSDLEPAGINFTLPVSGKVIPRCPMLSAWTSRRDGNSNIYSDVLGSTEVVDTSRAQDSHPAVTAFGHFPYSYRWIVWQSDRDGNWNLFGTYRYYSTGVEQGGTVSEGKLGARLLAGSPYRPGSRAALLLPDGGMTKGIRFYDLQGRLLGEHDAERKAPGHYEFSWDGRDASGKALPSGLYFLRAEGTPNLFRLIMLR